MTRPTLAAVAISTTKAANAVMTATEPSLAGAESITTTATEQEEKQQQ